LGKVRPGRPLLFTGAAVSVKTFIFFIIMRAPFFARGRAKKPGYPLQVLGSADALPAGFPLLSLAPHGLSYAEKANRKNHTVINCV
jgi:hypothetical protein